MVDLGNNIFEPGKEGSGYKGSGSGSGDKVEEKKGEKGEKGEDSKETKEGEGAKS